MGLDGLVKNFKVLNPEKCMPVPDTSYKTSKEYSAIQDTNTSNADHDHTTDPKN